MIKLSQGNSEDGAKETEAKIMRERVLRVLLSPEARQRLTNVKMVKPELAKAVEDYIISMGSQGKLNKALTDDDLKQILSSIQQPKRDFKINYK
ncbi:MAG: programmed cell death protein 5 [Candidatus Nitrosomirales archaeon]